MARFAWRCSMSDRGSRRSSQTRRHVLVYDTGPLFRSGTDTGLLVVEPYLRSRGIRRVDLLVASHDDDDHVGGAASLSALLDVRARVASGRALDALGPVTRCRAGQGWEWDGVRFQWLHPGDPLLPGDNDRSCVLEVRAGSRTLLLAGDAERLAEQQMLDRGPCWAGRRRRRPAPRQSHVVERGIRRGAHSALGGRVGRSPQPLGFPRRVSRRAMGDGRSAGAADVGLRCDRIRRDPGPSARPAFALAHRSSAALGRSLRGAKSRLRSPSSMIRGRSGRG